MRWIGLMAVGLVLGLLASSFADDGLPSTGWVVGEVIEVKDAILKVKVVEFSKGCEALKNETMEFYCQWIKKNDKWVSDPKEVELIHSVKPGDRVKIAFYRDEHWRIENLAVIKRAKSKEKESGREEEKRKCEEENKKESEHHENDGEKAKSEDKHREDNSEKSAKKEPAHKPEKEESKKQKELPEGWPKEGALLGEVIEIGEKTISIRVLKTSKGAEKMIGEIVTFYVNWIKNKEGQWIPNPEEVHLFHSVKVGDKVEVRFYFEEHYRISKMSKV